MWGRQISKDCPLELCNKEGNQHGDIIGAGGKFCKEVCTIQTEAPTMPSPKWLIRELILQSCCGLQCWGGGGGGGQSCQAQAIAHYAGTLPRPRLLMPALPVCCPPSYWEGIGGRTAWDREFEASLGNIKRPIPSQSRKREQRRRRQRGRRRG